MTSVTALATPQCLSNWELWLEEGMKQLEAEQRTGITQP